MALPVFPERRCGTRLHRLVGVCRMHHAFFDDEIRIGKTCFDVPESPFDHRLATGEFALPGHGEVFPRPFQGLKVDAAARNVAAGQRVRTSGFETLERVDYEGKQFHVDLEGGNRVGRRLFGLGGDSHNRLTEVGRVVGQDRKSCLARLLDFVGQ